MKNEQWLVADGDVVPVYDVAERFKSIQGEGVWAGTPMAFIRFVGCSVGKKVCNACDTDFERALPWRGGGAYGLFELLDWVGDYGRACLTGGEPADQELLPLLNCEKDLMFHLETSGTVELPSLTSYERNGLWICVSPKPGYRQSMLERADELKIIVPGLGSGEGWPTLEDALAWAKRWPKKPIFLQPKNLREDIDQTNLALCEALVREHPELRLSVQLHKVLKVR